MSVSKTLTKGTYIRSSVMPLEYSRGLILYSFSWRDGRAFCALIHSIEKGAFDFAALDQVRSLSIYLLLPALDRESVLKYSTCTD